MLVIAVDVTMWMTMMAAVSTVATSQDEEVKGARITDVVLMIVFGVVNR